MFRKYFKKESKSECGQPWSILITRGPYRESCVVVFYKTIKTKIRFVQSSRMIIGFDLNMAWATWLVVYGANTKLLLKTSTI